MRNLLRTVTITTVLACLIYSLLPAYQNMLAKTQASQSLASLRHAYQLIKQYEEDHKKLPNPTTWVQTIGKDQIKKIEDPVYKEITKIEQPYNPGWGMNTRLLLPLGISSPTPPKNPQSKNLYPQTVLLGPSFSETLTPLTNGDLPLENLSARNPTPTDHRKRLGQFLGRQGTSSLYLLVNGAVKQLTPEKSKEYLKLNQKKPTETAKTEKTHTDSPPYWIGVTPLNPPTTKKASEPFRSHLIPLLSPPIESISVKYKTPKPMDFKIQVHFYNQYKQPINTNNKIAATLTSQYGGHGAMKLSKQFPSRTILGLNPSEGHITDLFLNRKREAVVFDPIGPSNQPLKKHYQKGSPIGTYQKTSLTKPTESTTPNWKTKKVLEKKEIPPYTEFVEIEIIPPKGETILVEEPIITKSQEKK